VKKLYLYLKYGNEMLKKKVTPPPTIITQFVYRFIAWMMII
jgi:hypothetical protein